MSLVLLVVIRPGVRKVLGSMAMKLVCPCMLSSTAPAVETQSEDNASDHEQSDDEDGVEDSGAVSVTLPLTTLTSRSGTQPPEIQSELPPHIQAQQLAAPLVAWSPDSRCRSFTSKRTTRRRNTIGPTFAGKFTFHPDFQETLGQAIVIPPSRTSGMRRSLRTSLTRPSEIRRNSATTTNAGGSENRTSEDPPVAVTVCAFVVLARQLLLQNIREAAVDMVRTLSVLSGITFLIVLMSVPGCYSIVHAPWDDPNIRPYLRSSLWALAFAFGAPGVVAMHTYALGWLRAKTELAGCMLLVVLLFAVLAILIQSFGTDINKYQIDSLVTIVFGAILSVYSLHKLRRRKPAREQSVADTSDTVERSGLAIVRFCKRTIRPHMVVLVFYLILVVMCVNVIPWFESSSSNGRMVIRLIVFPLMQLLGTACFRRSCVSQKDIDENDARAVASAEGLRKINELMLFSVTLYRCPLHMC